MQRQPHTRRSVTLWPDICIHRVAEHMVAPVVRDLRSRVLYIVPQPYVARSLQMQSENRFAVTVRLGKRAYHAQIQLG